MQQCLSITAKKVISLCNHKVASQIKTKHDQKRDLNLIKYWKIKKLAICCYLFILLCMYWLEFIQKWLNSKFWLWKCLKNDKKFRFPESWNVFLPNCLRRISDVASIQLVARLALLIFLKLIIVWRLLESVRSRLIGAQSWTIWRNLSAEHNTSASSSAQERVYLPNYKITKVFAYLECAKRSAKK